MSLRAATQIPGSSHPSTVPGRLNYLSKGSAEAGSETQTPTERALEGRLEEYESRREATCAVVRHSLDALVPLSLWCSYSWTMQRLSQKKIKFSSAI